MNKIEVPKKAVRDPLIIRLNTVIKFSVKVLSVLMVILIMWSVFHVIYVMAKEILAPPYFDLNLNQIVSLFGDFLAVLIAIEIFMNIIIFLEEDTIHIQLVIATALIAIARKVIIVDFTKIESSHLWATGVVILSLGITYWLLNKNVPKIEK